MLFGLLTFLTPATAFAYIPCQAGLTGAVSSSTVPVTGGAVTFTATFKDCNGNPVAAANVNFSQQSGPAGCQAIFSSATGTTDANGQVSVTVTFPAKCPGQYVLAGSNQGVTVTVSVSEAGGFPNTTADPSQAPASWPAWALLGLGAALVLGVGSALVIRLR